MIPRRKWTPVTLVAVGLLLLGLMGAYWPSLVAAKPVTSA